VRLPTGSTGTVQVPKVGSPTLSIEATLLRRQLPTRLGVRTTGDVAVFTLSARKGIPFMNNGRLVGILFLSSLAAAQEMPADYAGVLQTLGKQGDFKGGVLKINIPRNDVKVTIDGIATPTPFGFGGWLAMTKGDGGTDVMMGDLVLLEDEVNPVMSALLSNGLEATALHNHFFFESPRIFYMHVHGHGKAADLAKMAKPAIDLIGHGRRRT
jgi:hypothetical protein